MARCKFKDCKRKIPSTLKDMYRCRCTHLYCSRHRLAHNCTFDYTALQRSNLKRDLPVVEAKKVIKV